jgi:hypothetical protein
MDLSLDEGLIRMQVNQTVQFRIFLLVQLHG